MAEASALELIERAKADGIRFVQLQFTDILGIVKAVTIPIHQMEGSVKHGTWFDGSSIEGFTRIAESDQYLMPDMSTFAEIPWQKGSGPRGTARVICDVFTPRGEPFVGRPALRAAPAGGAGEEARLRRQHGPGARVLPLPSRRERQDRAAARTTWPATSTSRPTSPRRSARTWWTPSRHSGSRSRPPTTRSPSASTRSTSSTATRCATADNALTFKFTLKAIAQLHGLYATFMPKPIFGINGSGMHTHQSLYSIEEGRNAFADPGNKYGLSDLARSYMAGILAHAKGMAAVLAPTVNSYKRLVPGYEAPTYITWGRTNRSALIRVPMISPGKSIEGTRAEVRCPDPSSNTYLAFAVMIAAGLDGVERGLALSEPGRGEPLRDGRRARSPERGITELPGTLGRSDRGAQGRPRGLRGARATTSSSTTSTRRPPSGTSTGPRSRSGSWTATSRRSEARGVRGPPRHGRGRRARPIPRGAVARCRTRESWLPRPRDAPRAAARGGRRGKPEGESAAKRWTPPSPARRGGHTFLTAPGVLPPISAPRLAGSTASR